MEKWEAALKDYQAGMKYQEIAEKYGVSLSAVKSWAARKWKQQPKKKAATPKGKKLQPSEKKSQPRKRPGPGAPAGNSNAKGNAGGGAPPGNQNRMTHGAYAANLCWDTFTDEERALLEGQGDLDEETRLQNDIRTLDVRERRLMKMIAEQKTAALAVGYVDKVTGADGPKTITHAESTFDRIQHLESLLTSVQRAKLRYISELSRIRKEKQDNSNEAIQLLDDI